MNYTLKGSIKRAKNSKLRAPRSLKIYMDDIFGILKRNKEINSHIELINILNEIDPNVKFTYETKVDHMMPFLDTIIKKNIKTLQSMVYRKNFKQRTHY